VTGGSTAPPGSLRPAMEKDASSTATSAERARMRSGLMATFVPWNGPARSSLRPFAISIRPCKAICGRHAMRRERPGAPMEAAATDGPEGNLPLRLEGWPRNSSATIPQVFLRALEIADAIPTAAWKTLRISHSSHRLGGGSKALSSLQERQPPPAPKQLTATPGKGDISNELQKGTFLRSLDSVMGGPPLSGPTPASSCTADEVQGRCDATPSTKPDPPSWQTESRVSFNAWLGRNS